MTLDMRTKTNAPAKCADGGDHDWYIARQRGTRVRHACRKCKHIDPWEKSGPKGDHTVKATTGAGKSEVMSETPIHDAVLDATFWNGATVADLKEMAKKRGLTGYSKMKRDDLIAALS